MGRQGAAFTLVIASLLVACGSYQSDRSGAARAESAPGEGDASEGQVVLAAAKAVTETCPGGVCEVDFQRVPLRFDHLRWLMQRVDGAGKLSYQKGSGAGQRWDSSDYGTWPDPSYYDKAIGPGGFQRVASWKMSVVSIYAVENQGDWEKDGWRLKRGADNEGQACTDDTARGAVAFAEEFLRSGKQEDFDAARELLTFAAYMTTMDGKSYNFVWLDTPPPKFRHYAPVLDMPKSSYGITDARNLLAFAKALAMLEAKRKSQGLTEDEVYFARFAENHFYRLLGHATRSVGNPGAPFDSRLAAGVVLGLAEFLELKHVSRAKFQLGDPDPAGSAYAAIDRMTAVIRSALARRNDWKDGAFLEAGGDWQAWGQTQIFALAKAYRLKRKLGQDKNHAAVRVLLEDASYAANTFYGRQAYHYKEQREPLKASKQRIVKIGGGGARFETNEFQCPYDNSSVALGLIELGLAYSEDGVSTSASHYVGFALTVSSWFLGNNHLGIPLYRTDLDDAPGQIGTVFDGIGPKAQSFGASGESSVEFLWLLSRVHSTLNHLKLPGKVAFSVP